MLAGLGSHSLYMALQEKSYRPTAKTYAYGLLSGRRHRCSPWAAHHRGRRARYAVGVAGYAYGFLPGPEA
jgi:hypothetical protein